MRPETISLLRCPSGCEGALSLTESEMADGRIQQGCLRCAACGRSYSIEEGIARMLPASLSEGAASDADQVEIERKKSEMAARDAQTSLYDSILAIALFAKIEIPF